MLAYSNRSVVKVNLFEGKVKVSQGGKDSFLQSGEQAILEKQSFYTKSIKVNKQAYGFQGNMFLFRNQELIKVYEEITDAFGYRIRLGRPIGQSTFEAALSRENIGLVLHNMKMSTQIDFIINEKDKLITINP